MQKLLLDIWNFMISPLSTKIALRFELIIYAGTVKNNLKQKPGTIINDTERLFDLQLK